VTAPLLVVEIDALDYLQAEKAGKSYLDQGDYVSRFLEFFLQEQNFSEVVWIEAPQPWWKTLLGQRRVPCQTERSLEAARRSEQDLGRGCMKGWQVLFVLNKRLDEMTEFLATAQYRVLRQTAMGWKPDAVTRCLESIQVEPNQTIVLFAHDADPVFLIARQVSR
jgi:hypothetical protein